MSLSTILQKKGFEYDLKTQNWEYVLQPGKDRRKCQVKFCRNWRSAVCNGTRIVTRQVCWKCFGRRDLLRYPERRIYFWVKGRARRRGIEFKLTLKQFKKLVKGTRYIYESGSHSSNLQIDRINPGKGYVWGNVRIITASENIAKGNRERHRHKYDPDYEGEGDPF